MKRIELIGGWWHASDIDTALEELRAHLDEHDLGDALPEARLRADHASALTAQAHTEHDLEELQREHQIGVTAVAANEQLARRGDARRFRCFDRSLATESNEPPWFLVTPEEHAQLRGTSGPLDPLDTIYDEASSVADLPAIVWPTGAIAIEQLSPAEAGTRAYKAFWDRRYEAALALYPLAIADPRTAYLSEIGWLDTLLQIGDRETAAERWRITADRWLRDRGAWDSHWERLESLYGLIGLDDAPRIASVRSRKPGAPALTTPVELGTGKFDEEILLNVGALWMVITNVMLRRGDRVVVGDHDFAITEDITADRDRVGVRVLEDRPAPAKNTVMRFVRGV